MNNFFSNRIVAGCSLAVLLSSCVNVAFGGIGPKAIRAEAESAKSNEIEEANKKRDKDIRISPPHSHPHGRTYGEWSAAWWQWTLSIPKDRNPTADTTGEFCGEGQIGPVWFLGGTFGNSLKRSCTIELGKSIFMPIYNWIFGSGVFDCDPTVPGVVCDIPTLRAAAARNTEKAEILDVTIDGENVNHVRKYRAKSPLPFSITYPDNSVTGVARGTYYPHVSDGYWLMLVPQSKGKHTIRVRLRAPGTDLGLIEFEVVYKLTIR